MSFPTSRIYPKTNQETTQLREIETSKPNQRTLHYVQNKNNTYCNKIIKKTESAHVVDRIITNIIENQIPVRWGGPRKSNNACSPDACGVPECLWSRAVLVFALLQIYGGACKFLPISKPLARAASRRVLAEGGEGCVGGQYRGDRRRHSYFARK